MSNRATPTDERTIGDAAYREATSEDLSAMLELRNQIFPPVTESQFRSVPGLTAVVACAKGRVVGALPLAIREFQVAPGETSRVAFLHAVGTHPEWRGRGVGKRMVACAKEVLRDRVEALFVYRTGGERTDGYAFYQKSGFHELHFATTYLMKRASSRPATGVIRHVGMEHIIALEENLLGVFQALYSGMGGHWVRSAGFYRLALQSSYYLSRPHEFSMFCIVAQDKIVAYAIVGRPLLPRDAHRQIIIEIATLPGREHETTSLLDAVDYSAPAEAEIRFPTSVSSPLRPHILPYILEEAVRSPVLLGCLLDPAERARRAWKGGPLDFEVTAWTPSADFTIHSPTEANRSVTIGLKNDALLRLLLRRLDLSSACRLEAITLHRSRPGDEVLMAEALPAFPWVYHGLDYL